MSHRSSGDVRGRSPVGAGSGHPGGARRGGFTLIELLVVMVIISIILGFILNAAMESVKRAQERATQSLITKLESGLSDRLDALLQTRPDPNSAHLLMAGVYNTAYNVPMAGFLRAQAIAWYDYIKREMPDTFYVQTAAPTAAKGVYPLNFAGNQYPLSGGTTTDPAGLGLYILPLGNSVAAPYGDASGVGGTLASNTGLMEYNPTGAGIYGASYPAAAGIYKNLGYLPTGYDGVDNNGDGTVDDALEGINATNQTTVQTALGNHKHITARAEMLYALLVEGNGPLGSVFNRDDFTDKEVQDTDGDGLPEFVDAWGNPLQFFRWPILYHSDLQRGQVLTADGANLWTLSPPYASIYEQREQNPLDANQQLVAPAWWGSGYNNNSPLSGSGLDTTLGVSGQAQAFEYYFHRLTDPLGTSGTLYWDRGSTYHGRRAFYFKFLILSGGLDGLPGVFIYSDTNLAAQAHPAWALIANENNAMPFSPTDPATPPIADFTKSATYNYTTYPPTGYTSSNSYSGDPTNPSTYDLLTNAQDDITNQNIQITVGIGGAG
jgi:prepilin-type N-terminal cleavage/methylation domain-containing protein